MTKKKSFSLSFLYLFTFFALCWLRASTPTQGLAATPLPLRINVGSTAAFTAANGDLFLPDRAWDGQAGYVGGTVRAVPWWHYVGGTPTRQLHRTQRDNWEQYLVDGLPNGRYLITLHFSEQTVHGPGQKQFSVLIEGETQLNNLDLYAEVGRDYAYIRQFVTTVEDGRLEIEALGASSLAALEVESITPDSQPPAAPTAVTASSGYQAVLLNWADSSETDIDGYRIYRARAGGNDWQRVTPQVVYGSRYAAADSGTITYRYAITAVDVWGNESGLSLPVAAAPLSRSDIDLPILDLTVAADKLALLEADPFSDNRVSGVLQLNGRSYPIETRFRGWLGRHFPKKSWKIFFPGDSPFPGQDRINLNADYADWSLLRGQLSVDLFAQAAALAPEAEPMVLFLNGEYFGVYIRYEQIDEGFLRRTQQNPEATIYKVVEHFGELLPNEQAYRAAYEKETNLDEGYDDLIDFVSRINSTPDDSFAYEMAQLLDVSAYLRYYATIVLISHLDFTWHNTYLIHDPDLDRWTVVPWDFDFSWGTSFDSQTLQSDYPINMGTEAAAEDVGSNPLLTRLLAVPQYRAYYCQQLDLLMDGSFAAATMDRAIEAAYQRLAVEGLADWRRFGWEDRGQFTAAPTQMKQYVRERIGSLREQMGGYCAAERPFLLINEIMTRNETAVCDPHDLVTDCYDPWFEIYNAGLTPVDLNGYYLSNNASYLQQSPIHGSLIVPPLGHVVVWADGEPEQGVAHTQFSLGEFGDLFLTAPDGQTLVTAQHYSFLPTDFSMGRLPDGSNNWRLFSQPTPASSNLLLGPSITAVSHTPALPQQDDAVTITAAISDDGQLAALELVYQVDGGGFVTKSLSQLGDGFYSATIPPQPDGARVEYYIAAHDNDGNHSTDPVTAPNLLHEYRINYSPPLLRLNEFVAANETGLTDPNEPDERPDWIELYNPTPHTVDLGGLTLTDSLTERDKFQFSDELSIKPGGFLLLYADDDPEQGVYHTNFRLAADGEELGLFAGAVGNRQPIDTYRFGRQTADLAHGRCPDGGPWQPLPTPSPAAPNRGCKAPPHFGSVAHSPAFPTAAEAVTITADLQVAETDVVVELHYQGSLVGAGTVLMSPVGNGRFAATLPPQPDGTTIAYYVVATDSNGEGVSPLLAPLYDYRFKVGYERPFIFINELMARNETKLTDPHEPTEHPDWFELYNSGREPLDLEGYYLTDDLADPRQYRIPAGVVVPPRGFALFYADDDPEQGAYHTNFTLSGYGEVIGLYAPDGEVLIDAISFGTQPLDSSYGRQIDGGAGWENGRCSSPGAPNGCHNIVYLPLIR